MCRQHVSRISMYNNLYLSMGYWNMLREGVCNWLLLPLKHLTPASPQNWSLTHFNQYTQNLKNYPSNLTTELSVWTHSVCVCVCVCACVRVCVCVWVGEWVSEWVSVCAVYGSLQHSHSTTNPLKVTPSACLGTPVWIALRYQASRMYVKLSSSTANPISTLNSTYIQRGCYT